MKPFLKWAGNKYQIVERIRDVLPTGRRLVEPFVGSGAVFLNTDYPDYLLTDANGDLINLYLQLQAEKKDFVDYCRQFFVPDHNQKDAFYHFRTEFNMTEDIRYKSALFVYLNKHCFNGLCRYNSKGQFNVPFGRYKKPYFPAAEMLAFCEKAQSATFHQANFVATMDSTSEGDVVYCDPPYVPLSETANFTGYSADLFGVAEQTLLARKAEEVSRRGVPVIISNHDTEFTRREYAEAEIQAFDVQRYISSNGSNRGKAGEVLAVFS
ncbi:Dam family site-specific DNA-(adenine-N6)-methyltransferase [Chloroflexi bacterium TSY]|nr:Dam family site-specific DNA-(adenine-N6)-methyltransferase [Chloroflexi bacterium TSY]